jgi:hypothetical protein
MYIDKWQDTSDFTEECNSKETPWAKYIPNSYALKKTMDKTEKEQRGEEIPRNPN